LQFSFSRVRRRAEVEAAQAARGEFSFSIARPGNQQGTERFLVLIRM
jgi:hypothetical protein